MNFTTLRFLIFFLILFIVYWTIPNKFRWVCLLIADVVFYAFAGIPYLILLGFSILWSYLMGIWIDNGTTPVSRKHRLIPGVLIAVIFLCFFKYGTELFSHAMSWKFIPYSLRLSAQTLKIAMPLGVSFYTFQIIGYLADLCKGKIHAEHHLVLYEHVDGNAILLGSTPETGRRRVEQRHLRTIDAGARHFGATSLRKGRHHRERERGQCKKRRKESMGAHQSYSRRYIVRRTPVSGWTAEMRLAPMLA